MSSSLSTASISIPDLRSTIRGRVIAPEDADYDQARTVFFGDVDRHPAVIVRPADADDVAKVVTLARETGLELAVRSGGHSAVGYGVTDGGIVLDLRDMKAIEIDVDGQTAWARDRLDRGRAQHRSRGARPRDRLRRYRFRRDRRHHRSAAASAISSASSASRSIRCSPPTSSPPMARRCAPTTRSHPELFWAIRGGGGNFGVATAFTFRLHEVPEFTGGMLMLPATTEVIASFIAAGRSRTGRALDDRQRHVLPADAVRARGASRQDRRDGAHGLCRPGRCG